MKRSSFLKSLPFIFAAPKVLAALPEKKAGDIEHGYSQPIIYDGVELQFPDIPPVVNQWFDNSRPDYGSYKKQIVRTSSHNFAEAHAEHRRTIGRIAVYGKRSRVEFDGREIVTVDGFIEQSGRLPSDNDKHVIIYYNKDKWFKVNVSRHVGFSMYEIVSEVRIGNV